jgi:monoamine oxidase
MRRARRASRPSHDVRLTRREAVAAALIAGAAPRMAWGATEADVVVIGAGLAGLHAASILEENGARVVVVEAEKRIGGRLHTLNDLPGRPEAGAIQIGQGYRRLEAIAARLGVALVPGGAESRDVAYRINGKTVAGRDWAISPANHLVGAERSITPAALAGQYASKLPMLAKPEDWLTADMSTLDIPYARALTGAGASAEAMRLIGTNLNGNSLESLSLLHIVRALAIFRNGAGPTRLIGGGSQQLPEAMADALKGDLRLGARVNGIGGDRHGIRVSLASGSQVQAKHLICTIPFAAMRDMKIDAPLPKAMRTARRRLAYTQASFAFIAASGPFWRSDGLPETLWTDEALLGRVFVLGDDPAMLKVWVTGAHAVALDAMPDADAGRAIIAALERARPSATGKLSMIRRYSWSRSRSARGIYHHIGVGNGGILAAAVSSEGQRIHFAGEHLARGASGIEGALESGERAARTILLRL